MTKMKTNALWEKDSIAILWKLQIDNRIRQGLQTDRAWDSKMGPVIGKEEGAVASMPGNVRKIAQVRVNVQRHMRDFSVYSWHTERWTPRNEALMEAVVKQMREPASTRGR